MHHFCPLVQPNKKHKGHVRDYHRFFGVVNVNGKLYTVKIVTEKGKKNNQPIKLNLYGVYIEKEIKKPTADRSSVPSSKELEIVTEHEVPKGAPRPHGFVPSIYEMLEGVKDYYKKLYISEDGTPQFTDYKGTFKDNSMFQMAGENAKTVERCTIFAPSFN